MSCYSVSRVPWGWAIPPAECGCGSLPDWDFRNCDLQPSGNELRDAVVTSLYMQAKDGETGGWWGAEFIERGTGSRLWTLDGRSVDNDYIVAAERYAREALQWLLDIRAVASIRVFGEIENGEPRVSIELRGQNGDLVYSCEFERFWNG